MRLRLSCWNVASPNAQGRAYLRREMASILEDCGSNLSPSIRRLLDLMWRHWQNLEQQIDALTGEIEQTADRDPGCRRLRAVPGVRALVSTAIIASISNRSPFGEDRDFTAWVDLVLTKYRGLIQLRA